MRSEHPERGLEDLTAPSAAAFPAYPRSWFFFGTAAEVVAAPVSKALFGGRVVVFRGESGRLAALDAHCSHLGADLGRGTVVGDCVKCPYHGWEYGTDGRCAKVPGTDCVPAAARQRTYAVEERHGLIFLFNGAEPLFPLPFFLGEAPEQLVAGKPFTFAAQCSWYLLASHAFDTQHFQTVHDRALLAPPEIDTPAPYARRNRYRARVTGKGVFDVLLRRFAGKEVTISITTFGGTLFFLTGAFKRASSCFMIAAHPVSPDRCEVQGVCFAKKRGSLLDAVTVPLVLAVRRIFTRGYLRHEADVLGSTRYQPRSLTAVDRDLIDYFKWQAALDAPAAVPGVSASTTGATRRPTLRKREQVDQI